MPRSGPSSAARRPISASVAVTTSTAAGLSRQTPRSPLPSRRRRNRYPRRSKRKGRPGGRLFHCVCARIADELRTTRSSNHRPITCRGAMTMKLTATMMLSVDGVYQGPGGPDEDRRGGFERGGWTAAHADEAMWPFLTSWFERADALLLGRKTWEIWEPYWPHHDSGDPVSHGIHVLPKY